MIYVAGFILFFTGLQLLISAANLVFRQPLPKKPKYKNQLVSIMIPARNEEANIQNLLSDLKNQDYQNIEILVFNDQSTDKTAEFVEKFAASDSRIHLLESEELPDGWLGKNYACFSLAKKAKGDYFLFLDADVRIRKNIIPQTLSFAKKYKLGLLSIFPRQLTQSFGEYVTVPNMNFILLSLLPLVLVRKTNVVSFSAANGQFMLFNAKTYKEFNPHEKMKAEKVEDIKIARKLKKEKIKVACLAGSKNISCRMYAGYSDAVIGFSKNVIMFFGDSFFLATLFWLTTTFGFLFVLLALPFSTFLVYLAALLLTRILVSIASKQNILRNILLIIPQQITLGIFIYKALLVKTSARQLVWKGRNIS